MSTQSLTGIGSCSRDKYIERMHSPDTLWSVIARSVGGLPSLLCPPCVTLPFAFILIVVLAHSSAPVFVVVVSVVAVCPLPSPSSPSHFVAQHCCQCCHHISPIHFVGSGISPRSTRPQPHLLSFTVLSIDVVVFLHFSPSPSPFEIAVQFVFVSVVVHDVPALLARLCLRLSRRVTNTSTPFACAWCARGGKKDVG